MQVVAHPSRRRVLAGLLLLMTTVAAAPKVDTEQEAEVTDQSQREDKVFIALIKIPPDSCTTNDNANTFGTCMPSSECTKAGGTASGTCAKGLGTCCLVEKSCTTETTRNNTYFVSPDTTGTGSCAMTINRLSNDICQIRFDFITFKIADPDVDGDCANDFFTVDGATNFPPKICGINDGQHMYVDVDPNGGAVKAIIDRSVTASQNRQWNIKVSQISCSSKYRAPDGCLQYFTKTSDTVKSFNYQRVSGTVTALQGRQLANQNYAVCIKRASSYCSITWERESKQVAGYSFTVSGSASAILPDLIGDPLAASTGSTDCPNDYVIIPQGVDDTGLQADRYCGLGFPNSVTSQASPFVLRYKTSNIEIAEGDDANIGFSLTYRQNPTC